MISAVIGEEIGFAGITVLVGLYMLFGYGGFRTAQRAKDRYGRLLAAALTAMILIQATINLYAAMGMAPLTGVTLPFVSYGNSSLIVTLAAVGLLLNVANGGTAAMRPGRPRHARAPGARRPVGNRRRALAAEAERGERRRATPARAAPATKRRQRPSRVARPAAEEPVPHVVIAAGGTAGHVVPALAVADALAERGATRQLHRHARAGRGRAGPGGRLRDRLPRRPRARPPQPDQGAPPRPGRAGIAVRAARRLLRERGADAVMGGGGYVAGPAGLAAAGAAACRWS